MGCSGGVWTECSWCCLDFLPTFCHSLLALAALVFIGLGVYIKPSGEKYAVVLEGLFSGILPSMLIAVGTLLFFVHAVGPKLSAYCLCREQREDIRMVLQSYTVGLFLGLVMYVTMATVVLCIQQSTQLENAFQKGVTQAMKRYKDMHHVKGKEGLDTLQIKYGCCGSESHFYEERFTIPWINNRCINGTRR